MLPALVFFNIASGAERSNGFYKPWAEIAASKDSVAILPDLRDESFEKRLRCAGRSSDRRTQKVSASTSERIALDAGSGNVSSRSLPLVLNPKQTGDKGRGDVLRLGAGDRVSARPADPDGARGARPAAGQSRHYRARQTCVEPECAAYAAQLRRVVTTPSRSSTTKMRPVTSSTPRSSSSSVPTAPAYQASLRRALPEATAAAHVASGNFAAAAASYAELVKAKPDDARMRLSVRRSAAWRVAVRRGVHRARETERKGPRSAGSRRPGRARVHAEGRCRSCARAGSNRSRSGFSRAASRRIQSSPRSRTAPSSRPCFRRADDLRGSDLDFLLSLGHGITSGEKIEI